MIQNLPRSGSSPCDDDGGCSRANLFLEHDINPDNNGDPCSCVWRLQLEQQPADHQ